MRLQSLAFAIAMATPVAVSAQSGIEMLRDCQELEAFIGKRSNETLMAGKCLGFIQGATRVREFLSAGVQEVLPKWRDPICIPEAVTNGQLARVFVRYLEQRPDILHEHVGALFVSAMVDAFPCRGK